MQYEDIICFLKPGLENQDDIVRVLKNLEEITPVTVWVNNYPNQESYNHPVFDTKKLFVAVGGDGTMLAAAKAAAKFNAPVIGFNHGRLGFLVEHSWYKAIGSRLLEKLITTNDLASLDLFIEERMLIKGNIGLGEFATGLALNEILIAPNTLAAPFRYHIVINGKHVACQNSSGILVATPTGSTAFSLSLGGSVMLPTAKTMQIIPLAAHTLTSRPIIIGENDRVQIITQPTDRIDGIDITVDGRKINSHPLSVSEKNIIDIQKAHESAKIIHHNSWDFFSTLSQKLKWDWQ